MFAKKGGAPSWSTIPTSSSALASRVMREREAHKDDHIDEEARRWWARFPHVFNNPAMRALHKFYEDEIGDVTNKQILEYGCGQGNFALWLLRKGARVTGIDISEHNIDVCRKLANVDNQISERGRFEIMDAHRLAFADGSFDLVVGNGILHHLEIPTAFAEVCRVLRPGGKALFQEPMAGNPLLAVYRWLAGFHTEDERPLGRKDLKCLKRDWAVRTEYTGLITLPIGVLSSYMLPSYPDNYLLRWASSLETALRRRQILNCWHRFVVLIYEKRA